MSVVNQTVYKVRGKLNNECNESKAYCNRIRGFFY